MPIGHNLHSLMNPVLFMSGSMIGFSTAELYLLHILIWAVNFFIRHQHGQKRGPDCVMFTHNKGV